MTREELTQEQRWIVADWLAEDRLPEINRRLKKVKPKRSFYTFCGKRMLDIAIALPAVLLTLPINMVIGAVTYFDVGSPIFFLQERVGKKGKIFKIVKFRNMRNAYDERGELLPSDQRVTTWGKFVRKTSLDELMNFLSVLKGDMSIIGPRPLVPQYMSRYNKRHLSRYAVKPGLECPPRSTGSALRTWQDQFENDVWYVENLSFKTDLMMAVNLVKFALDRKSSSARGSAGRGDFMGYDKNGIAINLKEVPDSYLERAEKEFGSKEK